ncbi:hypothetical protein KCTC32516_01420 [Polaribacter huanghezhanensis]|uniref:hypothetical protein n=1 Tax=Polaribacter huanghezhanensis TaxID=1354726 RepID=UPI002649B2B6|nr:hypothetical protein [Polaribacter huanghezhanensis]WKD86068.1 hypothetical protein KCTC32516_01420 [Polaribacter huanghezhanensis]
MRTLIFFVCLLFIFSCNTGTKPQKPEFLLGKWIRTNDKSGNTTYEIWNKNFTGVGFIIKEKDTTFKETLGIVAINNTLTLKVEGVNETPPLFQFTSQTDTSFVAENPTHNFPTKIIYWLENKQLKARVSNNQFGIEFVFEKFD